MASNDSAPNATPTSAQRRIPGGRDSTATPQHRLPVNSAGPLTLTARTPAHAVTGPGAWENGRDVASVPTGPPPVHAPDRADCMPGGSCT